MQGSMLVAGQGDTYETQAPQSSSLKPERALRISEVLGWKQERSHGTRGKGARSRMVRDVGTGSVKGQRECSGSRNNNT